MAAGLEGGVLSAVALAGVGKSALLAPRPYAESGRLSRELTEEVAGKMAREYQPKKIVPFGSGPGPKATEDNHTGSVGRCFEVKSSLRDTAPCAAVSPLVHTHKGVGKRIVLRDLFFGEILEEREVLYE